MGKQGDKEIRKSNHRWKSWSIIATASAVMSLIAFSGEAYAMGPLPNGGMDLLLPNTVTVEGTATEAIINPVSVINYSMNVNDSTFDAVDSDVAAVKRHETTLLGHIGIPTGDILFAPPSINSNNGSPQASLQINVIVGNAANVENVLSTMGSYQPSFASNVFTNIQVVPLNPAAMWPKLYQTALNNARLQAEVLASQAGMQVGSVVSISTIPEQGVPQTVSGPYPTSPSVAGMQLQYGNGGQPDEVNAQIYVCFALVKMTS